MRKQGKNSRVLTLVGGKRESQQLSVEIIDISAMNSMASSFCSSVSTLPDEGIARNRSFSILALDRQIRKVKKILIDFMLQVEFSFFL